MIYTYPGPILEAVFVNRPNRFIAEVALVGEIVKCHVKNTGRMKELLIPGERVYIQKSLNDNRKTKFDLISVFHKGIIVNLDSQIPNKIVADAFLNSKIKGWEEPDYLKREVKVGNSRLDMVVEKNHKRLFVEVKGVDLVKKGVHAMFPDAPTTRGVRHLGELEEVVARGDKAMVIFLIARQDALYFSPNYEMDPVFSDSFYRALHKGVEARAYLTKNTINTIEFYNQIQILPKNNAKEGL